MAQSEGQSVAAGGAADHLGVDEHARASRRRDRKHSNDAQSRKLIAGVLAALFGGAFWGLSGTCASYLFDVCHLDTMWLLAVRQLAAGALFMIVILATDRARFVKLLHNKRHLGIMVVFTFLGIFANQLFYLVAARMTNAGTATVLQCLQLVLIMGYTCIRSRRTPRPREIAGLVLAFGGSFLIATGGDPTVLVIPPLGLAMGLLPAVAAACISIIPVKILPEYGSSIVTGSAMFCSGSSPLCLSSHGRAYLLWTAPVGWRWWCWWSSVRSWRTCCTCRA